jgi:sensor domain CHASE-containing protein
MKAKSGFVLREVGEGTVLVPTGERVVDMNGMIVLNDTGKFVWERLDGSHTPEQIAEALTETYEVSLEDARADVNGFLSELGELGILDDEPASN